MKHQKAGYELAGDRSLPPHFSIIVLDRGKVADDKPQQYEANGHGGCWTAAQGGT